MPETPTALSFSDVRGMNLAQFNKLTKQQLSAALKDAVEAAEIRDEQPLNIAFSPQMLKSVVAEAVAEIKQDLLRETQRLISAVEEKVQSQLEGVIQKMSRMREEMKAELLEENRRRESRKDNVIIFGLLDGDKDPRDHVTELFSTMQADVNESCIKTCFRLGVKGPRPRPVKVVLNSQEVRRTIFKSAPALSRLDRDHAFYRVYIKPDLTPDQLIQDKKLREELKRHRQAGANVKIRAGKLMIFERGQ